MSWWRQAVLVGAVGVGILGLGGGRQAAAEDAPLPDELRRKLAELDKSGDGRLQPEEVPVDAAAFARADRDQDGALSPREALRLWLVSEVRKKRGQDDVARRFREADRDGDGRVTAEEFPGPEALFTRFDRDGDGAVSWAEAQAAAVEDEVAKAFAKHDADLSGTLSREEVPAESRPWFELVDADGDAQLSGEEVARFLTELRTEAGALRPSPSAAPAAAAPAASGAGAERPLLDALAAGFSGWDRDGDGRLGPEELPASRQALARLDVDGDGAVDRAELELRRGQAKRLVERALELRRRAEGSDRAAGLALYASEARGLLLAGDLEALARLLDDVELRLSR